MDGVPALRSRRRFGYLLASVMVTAVAAMVVPALAATAEPGACVALEVQTAEGGGDVSTLTSVDLSTGRTRPVRTLDFMVNAIGYTRGQDVVYGIALHDLSGLFGAHDHLVHIERDGTTGDLGEVVGPHWTLTDPTAGVVIGSTLYVRAGDLLYEIDVDPSSTSFRHVVRSVRLAPAWLADTVDDFDLNPADGLLYGVSTVDGDAGGTVVSIDPDTGTVREVRSPPGLPAHTSYGSVTLDNTVLYATANDVAGRSRLYRVPLGGGSVTELTSGPPARITDAAGCLPPRLGPTPTSAPPPGTNAPATPPPLSAPPAAGQALPPVHHPTAPTSATGTSTTPTSSTAQPAAPPTTSPPGASKPHAIRSAAGRDQSDAQLVQQRRWALALLVIIIGGAAAARARPSRS
jgi:hypothetical protein